MFSKSKISVYKMTLLIITHKSRLLQIVMYKFNIVLYYRVETDNVIVEKMTLMSRKTQRSWRSRGVVANVSDCYIKVTSFEL